MTKKRLTRSEMAEQLREEAAELIRLAEEIEATISEETSKPADATEEQPRRRVHARIEPIDVVRAMAGNMHRKLVLARKLGVPIESLDPIMTAENGFTVSDKGWWKHDSF